MKELFNSPSLLTLLAALSASSFGLAVLLGRKQRLAQLVRDRALGTAPGREGAAPAGEPSRLLATARGVGEMVAAGAVSRSLQQELAHAGYHGAGAPTIYLGTKVLLLVVGAVLGVAAVMPLELPLPVAAFAVLTLATTLSFVPNVVVASRRARRRETLTKALPDAVDMLEICVSSGMGLDQSWNSVAEEFRRVSPVFSDEMELTNLEIHLGASRATALRHMADRTGVEELTSLVAMLVQSEKFGASIADALGTYAQSMREARSQKAEEAAEKMSVKLLFPMVMFIFPALLVVMMGPALIELVDELGG